MGGAEFLYVRHESGMETLTARGPLIEPIVVEVCVQLKLTFHTFVIYCLLPYKNCVLSHVLVSF